MDETSLRARRQCLTDQEPFLSGRPSSRCAPVDRYEPRARALQLVEPDLSIAELGSVNRPAYGRASFPESLARRAQGDERGSRLSSHSTSSKAQIRHLLRDYSAGSPAKAYDGSGNCMMMPPNLAEHRLMDDQRWLGRNAPRVTLQRRLNTEATNKHISGA